MSRWAAPEANGIAARSAEVFRMSHWAAPEANGIAARSAEVCQ